MKLSVFFGWIVVLTAASFAAESDRCEVTAVDVEEIRSERITGSLAVAETAARRLLPCSGAEGDRLALRIELAKILDRVGLHTNTRPVEEALGDRNRARELYLEAEGLAAKLGVTRTEKAAGESLARLTREAQETTPE